MRLDLSLASLKVQSKIWVVSGEETKPISECFHRNKPVGMRLLVERNGSRLIRIVRSFGWRIDPQECVVRWLSLDRSSMAALRVSSLRSTKGKGGVEHEVASLDCSVQT